ncbi:hypothetical protein XENTR_v10018513 [Xenopus tropicalis]|nr:hypothetical protein XENTR_v10018513 [Xenopus tropicalis]
MGVPNKYCYWLFGRTYMDWQPTGSSIRQYTWFLCNQNLLSSQEFKNEHLLLGHWEQCPRGWSATCCSRATGWGSLG